MWNMSCSLWQNPQTFRKSKLSEIWSLSKSSNVGYMLIQSPYSNVEICIWQLSVLIQNYKLIRCEWKFNWRNATPETSSWREGESLCEMWELQNHLVHSWLCRSVTVWCFFYLRNHLSKRRDTGHRQTRQQPSCILAGRQLTQRISINQLQLMWLNAATFSFFANKRGEITPLFSLKFKKFKYSANLGVITVSATVQPNNSSYSHWFSLAYGEKCLQCSAKLPLRTNWLLEDISNA